MELLLGVDGGQSSTAALLATVDGRVLGVGRGGPANHIHEPGGVERMEISLRSSVLSAFANAGLPPQRVASTCFGMTGGMDLVTQIAPRLLETDRLTVVHDVVSALAGASRGQPGLIVIAGTGAIAFGRTADGREAKADGVGYLLGDEGGGYWIGVQALNAMARALDGRGPSTILTEAIPQALGQPDFAAIHRAVYSQQVTRPQIAALSSVAGRAADGGDAVAQNLLRVAGIHLAETALAVSRRLHMNRPTIYTSGGVFHAGDWVLKPFRDALRAEAPLSEVVASAYPQVVGALILARQQIAGPLSEPFFQQIDQSLPESVRRK